MYRMIVNKLIALTFLAGILLAGCGKTDVATSESSLLEYVPGDSPYVLASTTPVPDDVMDKLEPVIGKVLNAYSAIIRAAITDGSLNEDGVQRSEEELAKIEAVGNEIAAMMTLEGIRGAGIGRDATSVFYGNGLLPVIRVSLTDGALMEAAIARIEEKAGSKMEVANIGDVQYRVAGDDKAKIIVAVIENELVVGLVPSSASEELLKSSLGITKPRKSIADSGELAALAKEHGYLPYVALLFDTKRLASSFVDPQSGANKELLEIIEHDAGEISETCRNEILEVAAIMPRVVGGYTKLTPEGSSSSVLFELREDLAKSVSGLVAPVQGLGLTEAGLFSFGMSFDLAAIREFYSQRLDAMEANPYKCEYFADLQGSVAQGREMLQQPVIPIFYSIKGFMAVVDGIEGLDMATKQPPTSIDASFLLSVDNPQGLLAMGQMFSPDLAALDIKPDGVPARVPLPPISEGISEGHIAMTDKSIAFAIGADSDKKIAGLFAAEYAKTPPFMSMNMDGERYYGFINDAMAVAEQEKLANGESSAAMSSAMGDLMSSFQSIIGQMNFSVNFTSNGIEVESDVEMQDGQ